MDGNKEGCGVLCIASSNATPTFEVKEGVFNEMPQTVEIFVIRPLDLSVSFGRDNNLHALLLGLSNNDISIVSFVCKEMFGSYALDELTSVRAIRCGTFRNKDSDRHTMRIHGQV